MCPRVSLWKEKSSRSVWLGTLTLVAVVAVALITQSIATGRIRSKAIDSDVIVTGGVCAFQSGQDGILAVDLLGFKREFIWRGVP